MHLIRINHRMQACVPGVAAAAVVAVAEAAGVQGAAIDKNPTYFYDRIMGIVTEMVTGMVTGMVTFVIHHHHHRLFRMSSAVPE